MTTTLDLYTNNIKGETMAVFRVVIEVNEPTLQDAQDHILSLSGSDLVDEIIEVEYTSVTKLEKLVKEE
tara:strand:+ start:211 stop:417 length:207 start_codon:yes stop_codon:yes gene_type:complete